MFIEHMRDENMTGARRKDPTVSDMIEFQQALVADHISGLEREAAALRAERIRDGSVAIDHLRRRMRLGRWLVAVGQSIAGTTTPVARPYVLEDDPCTDGTE